MIDYTEQGFIKTNYNINSVYKKTNNDFIALRDLIDCGPFDIIKISTINNTHVAYMHEIIEINNTGIKTKRLNENSIETYFIPFKHVEMIIIGRVIK